MKTLKQFKHDLLQKFIRTQFTTYEDNVVLLETRQLTNEEFIVFLQKQKNFILKKAKQYADKIGVDISQSDKKNTIVRMLVDKYAQQFREDYYNKKHWEI